MMMKRYLWAIPIGLAWPLAQIVFAYLRFGDAMQVAYIWESWIFFPFGLLTGLVLIAVLSYAKTRARRTAVIVGYLLAVPFAFFASLLGGWLLWFVPQFVGALVWGSIPLLVGMGIGYWAGGLYEASPSDA